MRSKVSLCVIAKNEEENLRGCLGPVAELFDEIIVVDTGSQDGTAQIAAQLGARVVSFPWCDDFSAARNAALDAATGDWIFWLDADDRVDDQNRAKPRALFDSLRDEPRAYIMTCVSLAKHVVDGATLISHARLFRRSPEIRWQRRVHEQILPSIELAGHTAEFSDIQIHHYGYQDPTLVRRKLNRDLRLLRLEYAVNPCDPVTLYNLGMTQTRVGNYPDALVSLLSCLKNLTNLRADWVRRLFSLAADVLQRLNRREEALGMLAQGLQHFPADVDLLTRRANVLCEMGDLGGAERRLIHLLRLPREQYLTICSEATLDRREARCLLGMIYRDQNRMTEAERMFQELLADRPDFVQAWVGLGYVYLALRKFNDLDYVCQQLAKCPDGEVYALVLKAEGLIARDAAAEARSLIDEAILRAPQMVWPRIVLSTWLFRFGNDRAASIAAQRDILRLDPGNALALENLQNLEHPRPAPTANPNSALFWTITT